MGVSHRSPLTVPQTLGLPQVGGVTVGQRDGFSRGDIKKLRAMYKCSGRQSSP